MLNRIEELYLISRSRDDKGEGRLVKAREQLEVVDEQVDLVFDIPIFD